MNIIIKNVQVYPGLRQRSFQSPASFAVNRPATRDSPTKGPVMWKIWACHDVIMGHAEKNTVRCRYNAVNFLQNPHNIHPIAHPWGRGMGCILWAQIVIYTLPQSLQWCMQYHVILDRVITALDCLCTFIDFFHDCVYTNFVVYSDDIRDHRMLLSVQSIVYNLDRCTPKCHSWTVFTFNLPYRSCLFPWSWSVILAKFSSSATPEVISSVAASGNNFAIWPPGFTDKSAFLSGEALTYNKEYERCTPLNKLMEASFATCYETSGTRAWISNHIS